jgi:hypothetical protein
MLCRIPRASFQKRHLLSAKVLNHCRSVAECCRPPASSAHRVKRGSDPVPGWGLAVDDLTDADAGDMRGHRNPNAFEIELSSVSEADLVTVEPLSLVFSF